MSKRIVQSSENFADAVNRILIEEPSPIDSSTTVKCIVMKQIQSNASGGDILIPDNTVSLKRQLTIEQCSRIASVEMVQFSKTSYQNQTGKLFAFLTDLFYQLAQEPAHKTILIIHGLFELYAVHFSNLLEDYEGQGELSDKIEYIPKSHYNVRFLMLLMNKLQQGLDLLPISQIILNDNSEISEVFPQVFLPLLDPPNTNKTIDFTKLELQIRNENKPEYISLNEILVKCNVSKGSDEKHKFSESSI